jgi:hypothetical protein
VASTIGWVALMAKVLHTYILDRTSEFCCSQLLAYMWWCGQEFMELYVNFTILLS